MPQIDAPTVAEHHARRRRQILTAAAELFADRGVVGTDLKDVASAVGLSRTAVYRYFPDRDRLFLAWADEMTEHVGAHLDALLAAHPDPHARLDAWITYQLEHVAGDDHAVGRRVVDELGALPPQLRERVERAHDELHRRLHDTVSELVDGDRAPAVDTVLVTRMIGAMIQAAGTHVSEGAALDDVVAATRRAARALLAASAAPGVDTAPDAG